VATPVTMPQLGETVVEGTITKWLKKEGEQIERDEPLFEISTDKVDTEVPSPVAGKIIEIKVPEGETVQVGTELAVIESDGQAGSTPAKAEEKQEPTPKAEEEREEADRAEEEAEQKESEEAKPDEERPRWRPPQPDPVAAGPAAGRGEPDRPGPGTRKRNRRPYHKEGRHGLPGVRRRRGRSTSGGRPAA